MEVTIWYSAYCSLYRLNQEKDKGPASPPSHLGLEAGSRLKGAAMAVSLCFSREISTPIEHLVKRSRTLSFQLPGSILRLRGPAVGSLHPEMRHWVSMGCSVLGTLKLVWPFHRLPLPGPHRGSRNTQQGGWGFKELEALRSEPICLHHLESRATDQRPEFKTLDFCATHPLATAPLCKSQSRKSSHRTWPGCLIG